MSKKNGRKGGSYLSPVVSKRVLSRSTPVVVDYCTENYPREIAQKY